jgi:hypothetical protein
VRSLWLLLLIGLLLAPVGCKQRRKRVVPKPSDQPLLASTISTADPRSSEQLLKGFYAIEGDSWRWAQKNFSVSLSPPRDAAQNGAQLILRFAIPEIIIQKLKSITLSAAITGLNLAPEKYTKDGQFTYVRDVPADRLRNDTVQIDFALDKALPPSKDDTRELGIIVTAVGLEIK